MAHTLTIQNRIKTYSKTETIGSAGKFLFFKWDDRKEIPAPQYDLHFFRITYPDGKTEDVEYGKTKYKREMKKVFHPEWKGSMAEWQEEPEYTLDINTYSGSYTSTLQSIINKLENQGYYAKQNIIAQALRGSIDTLIMQKK